VRLGDRLVHGIPRGRVLLVDEDRRVAGTETLALRPRERRERLVDQHDTRYSELPCCKCVAHGGAGAGPSGAYADHEIVASRCERVELSLLQRYPRIDLVRAAHRRRLAQILDGALEVGPEMLRGRILVPDETDAPADRGVEPAAIGLGLNARIADG